MSYIVRCKFRCLSITRNAEPDLAGAQARFLPVCPKSSAYPDGCEENKEFWDATPSGEMNVSFRQGAEIPFTLGRSYYIDLELSDDEDEVRWKLWEVAEHPNDVCVKLGLGWDNDRDMMSAQLEFCANNAGAASAFLGKADTKWRATFTEAPLMAEPEPACG